MSNKIYIMGPKSKKVVEELHPDLQKVVKLALKISEQDFTSFEGLRSKAKQAEYVRAGKSQTNNSRHLTGHAVDLVPYIDGKVVWDWEAIYLIADAMRSAAKCLNIPIRWGGAWVKLNDTTAPTKELVAHYVNRKLRQGKKAFNDGPHFELPRKFYPIEK